MSEHLRTRDLLARLIEQRLEPAELFIHPPRWPLTASSCHSCRRFLFFRASSLAELSAEPGGPIVAEPNKKRVGGGCGAQAALPNQFDEFKIVRPRQGAMGQCSRRGDTLLERTVATPSPSAEFSAAASAWKLAIARLTIPPSSPSPMAKW